MTQPLFQAFAVVIYDETDDEIRQVTEQGLETPDFDMPFECPVCHDEITSFVAHAEATDEEWGTRHHEAWINAQVLVELTTDPIHPFALDVLETIENWTDAGEEGGEFDAATAVLMFTSEFDKNAERYNALLDALDAASEALYEEFQAQERG